MELELEPWIKNHQADSREILFGTFSDRKHVMRTERDSLTVITRNLINISHETSGPQGKRRDDSSSQGRGDFSTFSSTKPSHGGHGLSTKKDKFCNACGGENHDVDECMSDKNHKY